MWFMKALYNDVQPLTIIYVRKPIPQTVIDCTKLHPNKVF